MWKWNTGEYNTRIAGYGYTAVGWHWGIVIGLIPLFLLHVWRRWPRPKKVDFTQRRQALKLIGAGAAAVLGWGLSEALARALEEEQTPRRFTGSRERGSFSGLGYPVTSGADQGKIKLDPDTWSLKVTGAVSNPLVLDYPEVLALSHSELIAMLDCTGGWYSTQTWQGVYLVEQRAVVPTRRGWHWVKWMTEIEVVTLL